jgi:exonuclease III
MLTVINVYCPRADPDNKERMQVKLRFYHLLEIRTRAILDSGSFVIICGDINTCHKPIDHCDPSDMVSHQFLVLFDWTLQCAVLHDTLTTCRWWSSAEICARVGCKWPCIRLNKYQNP